MFCMSIYYFLLGGHECYFKLTLYARVRCSYNVTLVGYGGWAESIMNLAHIHHIISSFHPEDGESYADYKLH